MRYIWTLFWAFLLIHMASYVISSMEGTAYDFTTSSIIAVILAILVFILGSLIPNEAVDKQKLPN